MAQREVATILFQVKNDGEKHVDLPTALGVMNGKQFHQFTEGGRPYCYHATIEYLGLADNSATTVKVPIATAPCGYPTVNALVQTSAAWNSQIERTGISKKKSLSRYGQRLRVGLIDDSLKDDGTLDHVIQPYASASTSDSESVAFDPTMTNEAGDSVTYAMIGEATTFVVPGDTQDDEPTEEPVVILSGATSASTSRFRAIREWTESRQGTAVEPDEGREVTTSSKMFRMFSDAQPETDEIIVELDEFQEFRPYSENYQYRYQDWGKMLPNSDGGQRSKIMVEAPCGLIQIGDLGTDQATSAPALSQWLITVHAITEM